MWMNSVKDPTSRLLRWRLKLAEYEYKILYKPGKSNLNADARSRNPVPVHPRNARNTSVPSLQLSTSRALSPITESTSKNATDSTNNELFPNDNPLASTKQTIIQIHDRLITRNDNVACFVTTDGQPLDAGGIDLVSHGRLKPFKGTTMGPAKVYTTHKYNLILLPVKESLNHQSRSDDVMEVLRSLYDVTRELNLSSVSLSKTSLEQVTWPFIYKHILELFASSNTTVMIYSNEICIPPVNARHDILIENHTSATGRYKGISKSYKRIRERYYWPSLKSDVQNYVRSLQLSTFKTNTTEDETTLDIN